MNLTVARKYLKKLPLLFSLNLSMVGDATFVLQHLIGLLKPVRSVTKERALSAKLKLLLFSGATYATKQRNP